MIYGESGHFPVANVPLPTHVENHKLFAAGVGCGGGRETLQPWKGSESHLEFGRIFFFMTGGFLVTLIW